MADRFYVNRPLALGPVEVEGPEAHHLAVVCRVRPGDAVCLFNGDGREYAAEVREVGRRTVTLEVRTVEAPMRERAFRLEIAAPLPKGDRAQFLIEKLTELGVTGFTPLQTARSVVHPRDAKLEKLQRYAIEASKQCGRNVLMEIGPLTEWTKFLERDDLPERKILAHPGGAALAADGAQTAIAAAAGPEGGFTDDEVEQARAARWEVVGLSPRILRVETAAMVLAVCVGDCTRASATQA
jgi:16S rRNA (uracil1498-N3)-methyltransferase